METKNAFDEEPYSKLKEEFTEDDFVYEQKIYSSDIDFSRYTNNAVYVKLISNVLSW